MIFQLELEAQREVLELAELMRKGKLFLKLEQMEMMDQTYSKGNVFIISESLRYQNIKASTWVNSRNNKFSIREAEPLASYGGDRRYSSRQADAEKSNQLGKIHLWQLPM